jgi:hypothetical protein
MTIDITSFFFNSSIEGATATAAWGTSIGQNQSKACRIEDAKPGVQEMLTGMLYKSISDKSRLDISAGSSNREVLLFSRFDKVYVNDILLEDQSFVVLLVRENTESHAGRLIISYPPYAQIDEVAVNDMAIKEMASALGCTENGCWFVYDISVVNQDELHFSAIVVNPDHPMVYKGRSRDRSRAWADMVYDSEHGAARTINVNAPTGIEIQKIFYGCPGTGKSRTIKDKVEGDNGEKMMYFDERGKVVDDPNSVKDKSKLTTNVFRTTFHPDYDYSTFVGSYKPVMNPVIGEDGDETGNEELAYEFVPQVFTNAYIRAWKSLKDDTLTDAEKQVYLIIEEINRGNCAQIFGDLFQLLDRKDGRSEFSIIPDAELRKHLAKEGLESNKLLLPENLHILATMNTSDQSLFPMDSAFKRRWAMEYVPINLDQKIAKDYTFKISDEEYSWVEFLRKINPLIRKATDSEDKQMGEFFIKGHVTEEEFVNKVMFYIWNDVCKDLYSASRISPLYFMRSASGEDKKDVFTFAELFGDGRHNEDDGTDTKPKELMVGFITKYLEMKPLEKKKSE